jgi:hypothetical protein
MARADEREDRTMSQDQTPAPTGASETGRSQEGSSGEPDGALRPEDIRDELPEDLDAAGYVGVYLFPDNSRRRIPGVMYLVIAAGCAAVWAAAGRDGVLVNGGFLLAAVMLAVVGLLCLTSGWRMQLDESDALEVATAAMGFPVGHASAQLAWRGLRSRPTWRILAYSADEPPTQRGFALVDAIDGRVVATFTEANPEDWAEIAGSR